MGSTWHVIAECQHLELVWRRKEVSEALMELLKEEVEQEGTVPAAWRRMYATEGTAEDLRWKKPEHWGTDSPAKRQMSGTGYCRPLAWWTGMRRESSRGAKPT